MAILKNDWAPLLEEEFEKPYYQQLRKKLLTEYETKVIYPDQHDIFNALHYTSYKDTKVVIIGQDPYHGPGQAHGLSFSVKPGVKILHHYEIFIRNFRMMWDALFLIMVTWWIGPSRGY
jgi:uracil-DNA glycosylase